MNQRLTRLRDRLFGTNAVLTKLDRLAQRQATTEKTLRRLERNMEAVLRLSSSSGNLLTYPSKLVYERFGIWSQNEEDGVTLALLREAGCETYTFVELGSGDNGGNSGFLAAELGWRGLFVDANEELLTTLRNAMPARVSVVNSWIERETVNDLLSEHGISGEIDLLSIDIDGNDYWLWQAIDAVSPRIVIVEYNSVFGPARSVVVPYDPGFHWERNDAVGKAYYGASLQAYARLGNEKGYRLVAVEPRGVNAYFLRSDVAPHIPACDPHDEYRLLDKHAKLLAQAPDLFAQMEQRGLPLVDLDVVEAF